MIDGARGTLERMDETDQMPSKIPVTYQGSTAVIFRCISRRSYLHIIPILFWIAQSAIDNTSLNLKALNECDGR